MVSTDLLEPEEEPMRVETPYFVSVSATNGTDVVTSVSIEPVLGAVGYNEYARKTPWYRRIWRRR